MAKRESRRFKPPVMLATVFRRAREVLDRRGWCQGALEDERGACCLVGSLNVATLGSPHGSASQPALVFLATLIGGVGSFSVVPWNNASERRKREVIALLKRAERKAAREKARLVP